ncbi:MAG: hypothetical protein HY517_01400 [Candidatus Aenigmarchaeota archaeon]|nr:hypothetical protein [Candidatus Aenigmarchaeota archaeon]MBI4174273.1 hypothetical protein [Candidatus Aenigmarchaeota archaeon]
MLNPKKQKAIIAAHMKAKAMDKPYMRLCVDVAEPHPFSYEEVRRVAFLNGNGLASMIGPYEDAIRPYIERHFDRLGYPYTLLEVDGVKSSGRTNVALWMTKPDVEAVIPRDYGRAIADVSIIEVFRKVDSWDEVARKAVRSEEIGPAMEFSRSLGREDPLLFEVVYLFGGEDQFRGKASRLQSTPEPFLAYPPTVWHFYGGQPAPEWVLEINKKLRVNPGGFSDTIFRFMKETE